MEQAYTRAQIAAWLCAGAMAFAAIVAPARAAQFDASVEGDGAPLVDAVVSLHPDIAVALPAATADMDQVDSTFVPGVLPITVGTQVRFPNSDNTLHQVYSFSPTKRFELPLYSGRTAQPVTFESAGVVDIGCNIHDWMVGHIVVLDTPYFAKTDASGHARIDAPAGRYRLEVWHARSNPMPPPRTVELGTAALAIDTTMTLSPPPPPRPGTERLRALQDKFRSLGRDP